MLFFDTITVLEAHFSLNDLCIPMKIHSPRREQSLPGASTQREEPAQYSSHVDRVRKRSRPPSRALQQASSMDLVSSEDIAPMPSRKHPPWIWYPAKRSHPPSSALQQASSTDLVSDRALQVDTKQTPTTDQSCTTLAVARSRPLPQRGSRPRERHNHLPTRYCPLPVLSRWLGK